MKNSLKITEHALLTMQAAAKAAHPLEVSGFAYGRETVQRVVIPPQTVSGAHTEMKAEFMRDFRFPKATLPVWWHSHPMSLFWSATDEEAIENLLIAVPVLYSIEVNSTSYIARVDVKRPRISAEVELLVCDTLAERILEDITPLVTSNIQRELPLPIHGRFYELFRDV